MGARRVTTRTAYQEREAERRRQRLALGNGHPDLDGEPVRRDEDDVEDGEPVLGDEPELAAPVVNPYGLARRGRGYAWTRDAVLHAVQAFVAEHGHPPTGADALQAPNGALPSETTAKRIFGSWAACIEAAGFDRPTKATIYERTDSGREPRATDERSDAMPADAAPAGVVPEPSRPEQPDDDEEHRRELAELRVLIRLMVMNQRRFLDDIAEAMGIAW